MSHPLFRLLRHVPAAFRLPAREQARSALGALLGTALAGLLGWLALGSHPALPWLIAPMGASAVLLFAVPASPLAQPWPVVGGNLVSVLIGIACGQWIDMPLAASSTAVGCAIFAMFILRCLHPPGGAMALLAALGAPGGAPYDVDFALVPVLNIAAMLAFAVFYNRLCGRRYPHTNPDHANAHQTLDPRPSERLGVAQADLDAVLKEYNELLDISRDDLEEIIRKTEVHAYHRHFGAVTCADVMSTDVVTVEFGTGLKEAWGLLESHRLGALPVVNRYRRMIGLLTHQDFFRHLATDEDGLGDRLRRLLARTPGQYSDKPEVVGQVMCEQVPTVQAHQSIAELVPLFSDQGLHHAPVLDGNGRLVGMLSQADVIAALYHAPGRPAMNLVRAA